MVMMERVRESVALREDLTIMDSHGQAREDGAVDLFQYRTDSIKYRNDVTS